MAGEITFEEFLTRLSSQNCTKACSEFGIGASNGAVRALTVARSAFSNNFTTQSFFGDKWQRRKNNKWTQWLKRNGRPSIMQDNGTLHRSVRGAFIRKESISPQSHSAHILVNPSHIGERRIGSWRRQTQSYAGIHNAPSGTFQYGNTGAPTIQRQFIGNNKALEQGKMLDAVCEAINEKPIIKTIFT